MIDNVLHVVLAVQDKSGEYSRHIGVVIASVSENTQEKICFHLFHDATLTEDNKNKFEALCYKYSNQVQFHFIRLPVKESDLGAIKYISLGALYRLDIVTQIPDIGKVLYLDGDIVITMDIKEIFNINVIGYAIAAVKDRGVKENPHLYTRHIPVKLANYFNSGVILFNLSRIRNKYNLLNECLDILHRYPSEPFSDQAALNYILQDDTLFIDESFNRFVDITSEESEKCIWHFAGGYKPWQVRMSKIDSLYWKYIQKTPWGEDVEQLFNYYAQTVVPLDIALLSHPVGSRKKFFRNVLKRIIKEIKEVKKRFFS